MTDPRVVLPPGTQPLPPVPTGLVPRSPEWWVEHMFRALDERARRIQLYEDYYQGRHRLRFTTLKMRETFANEFGAFADNFCRLVVDAVEERLQIRGFRILEDETTPAEEAAETPEEEAEEQENEAISNDAAWRIWRANDLDITAPMAHIEALVNEESYIIVWADPDDEMTPQITVESPFQVICSFDPANRRKRTAALKRWVDGQDGNWRAVLYLPDAIYKYASVAKAGASNEITKTGYWQPWEIDGELWPLPNPLGAVPVIPLTNNPRMGGGGDSEISAVIPVQDAINKTVTDLLVASEFVAYPQRYMVGVEQPKDENDQPLEPFKAGVNRLWFIKQPEGEVIAPQIGQFPAANLDPYTNAIAMFIAHIGSITHTPKHYLIDPGGGTNLSGETLKALEAGLVAKARRKTRVFGDPWEEALAMAFRLIDMAGGKVPTTDDEMIETIWADVESRTEAQHVDSLLKLGILEVPTEQLWIDAGYTPQQVKRFKAMREAAPPPTQPVRVTAPIVPAATVAAAEGSAGITPTLPAVVLPKPTSGR